MTPQAKHVAALTGNVLTLFLMCFYSVGILLGMKSPMFGFVGVGFFLGSPIFLAFQIFAAISTSRAGLRDKTRTAVLVVNVIGILIFAFFTLALALTGSALALP